MAVFARINTDDYPEMKAYKQTIGPFPGGVIVEKRIAMFHRLGAAIGLATAPFRFWMKYRRTLSPDLREQVLLRNFARDHLAWGGGYGFVVGGIIGCLEGALMYPTSQDVVTAAIALRKDRDHDRWMKTWARCSVVGIMYGVLFVDRSSPLYRLGLGSGFGALFGVALSYSYFDLALSFLN